MMVAFGVDIAIVVCSVNSVVLSMEVGGSDGVGSTVQDSSSDKKHATVLSNNARLTSEPFITRLDRKTAMQTLGSLKQLSCTSKYSINCAKVCAQDVSESHRCN